MYTDTTQKWKFILRQPYVGVLNTLVSLQSTNKSFAFY